MGRAERSNRKKGQKTGGTPGKVASVGATVQSPVSQAGWNWLAGLVLIVGLFVAYTPVSQAGFVYDDLPVVTTNPVIIGPLGLKEIWTTRAADLCPLTLTTFWAEHKLWGLDPLPYHLVNVLLQAACAILLWMVLRELQVPGAWLGALLWALHPVGVASVAWITEMKNTESGVFFLLSILFFVKWLKARESGVQSGAGWNYALMAIFAALAMASKSSTVVLPGVLCLCAWWVERRWRWRNLAFVAPIVPMSVVSSLLPIMKQDKLLTRVDPLWARTWPQRLIGAGHAVWFYLGKLFWPYPLMAIYPRWRLDVRWFAYLPLLAVLVAFFVLWLKRNTWARPYFFVFAYFLLALLPVLGLIDTAIFRLSLVFDHFQYLASMGPIALAGAGMVRFADAVIKRRYSLRLGLCAAVLLVLALLSRQQAWAYQSEETLWSANLSKNPNCWSCYHDLGVLLARRGNVQEAIAQYEKSIEIYPNYDQAHDDLGIAFLRTGSVDAALPHFYRAVQLNPNFSQAYDNLGVALSQEGHIEEAIPQFYRAVQLNPDFWQAHSNLGAALSHKGDIDGAIANYQAALRINPNDHEIHRNLGLAYSQEGQTSAAIAQFQEALRLDPDDTVARDGLARKLAAVRDQN